MGRLDQKRQSELEPIRMASTARKLEEMGFNVTSIGGTRLEFNYKNQRVRFYPYSGWFSGKSVEDGRGFKNLLKQLI